MGNPVINIGALAPAAPSIQRPSEPAKPQANRSSAQDKVQPALPGVVATPTVVAGKREKQLVRAETASVPAPSFPTPVVSTKYKQRGDAPNLYTGDRALPMPIRFSAEAQEKAQPAQVVFSKAPEPEAAALPADQLYGESGINAGSLDVQLTHARKTMVGGAYRAPEGFWFFTADVKVENKSNAAVNVAPLNFELHDGEGARSMGLPEWSSGLPEGPLLPGASASGTLSFLVYDDVELKELALLGAAQPVLVPLLKK